MNSDGTLVRLEGIHKWFDTLHVLCGIDLKIVPKEVVVLMPRTKMYMIQPVKGAAVSKAETEWKVTRTGKRRNIAGHKASQWLIETKDQAMILWALPMALKKQSLLYFL